MGAKKYYWLKLQSDFFKNHKVKIIEKMTNGRDYVLFYLKLLVESLSHEGRLRFSDTIPYNEEMLASITDTNIDIVRSACKLLTELELMTFLDDRTIYMEEVKHMVGSETKWAEKKRMQRGKEAEMLPQPSEDIVPLVSQAKETVSDKRIEYRDKSIDIKDIYIVVDYLNEKTGKSFKATTRDTQRHIKARLNEGLSVEDLKKVINIKAKEWGNDSSMEQYLRPSTLFGSKCESYLNQKEVKRGQTLPRFEKTEEDRV